MRYKEGVIKVVAKTGGIKFEGEDVWYNPTKDAKAKVSTDLKNKKVILTLPGDSGYNFSDVGVISEIEKAQDIDPEKEEIKEIALDDSKITKEEIKEMLSQELKIEKKAGLNYASWAEAWAKLKMLHPDANFKVYEDNNKPYFEDKTGVYVKVGVIVKGIEHISILPVMDNKNKAMVIEAVDSFIINKTIQRALTKAIALHGVGLYVYQGEDIPK